MPSNPQIVRSTNFSRHPAQTRCPVTADLMVVGAGPAGIAAASEAARSGALFRLIDESGRAGGAIGLAYETRGIPFVADRTPGAAVARLLQAEADRLGGVERATIHSLSERPGCVVARTDRGEELRARAVVVATGATPMIPPVPGLPTLLQPPWIGSASDIEDALLLPVAVIGGSDVALDQARALRARGAAVAVLCRSRAPRAPHWLWQAAVRDGVEVLAHTVVASANPAAGGVELELRMGSTTVHRRFERVLAAVGRAPRRIEGMDALSMDRARIVGDAVGRAARHVAIAMGDGTLAAFELLRGARETER